MGHSASWTRQTDSCHSAHNHQPCEATRKRAGWHGHASSVGPVSIYKGHCVSGQGSQMLEGLFHSDARGQRQYQGMVLEPHTTQNKTGQERSLGITKVVDLPTFLGISLILKFRNTVDSCQDPCPSLLIEQNSFSKESHG